MLAVEVPSHLSLARTSELFCLLSCCPFHHLCYIHRNEVYTQYNGDIYEYSTV